MQIAKRYYRNQATRGRICCTCQIMEEISLKKLWKKQLQLSLLCEPTDYIKRLTVIQYLSCWPTTIHQCSNLLKNAYMGVSNKEHQWLLSFLSSKIISFLSYKLKKIQFICITVQKPYKFEDLPLDPFKCFRLKATCQWDHSVEKS